MKIRKKKKALHYLIALNDDISEVYDSSLSYYSDGDEIHDLYNELYDSLVKAKKELRQAKKKKKILLKEQIKMIKVENVLLNVMIKKPLVENNICNKCKIYEAKIKDLQSFTSSKQKLNNILGNQKNF